jgi:DNA primase catalytic core
MALPTPDDLERGVDPDRMRAANTAACDLYHRQLQRAYGPRHYLRERGFGAFVQVGTPTGGGRVATWSIGYAPPGPTMLTDQLARQGFTPDEMLAAGLARRTGGGRLADVFRERIVFPIRNATAQTVGFIGRAAPRAGPDVPKYLNTRDTIIYHKGQTLYGLAEQADRLADGWVPVLVEGPLDVLAVWLAHPHSADIGHAAVATCGSMLTAHHVAMVCALPGAQRHGVTTCFDNDSAGRDATVRAWRLLPPSIDTHAAGLPNGADPADHAAIHLADLRSALADRARPLTLSAIDIHLDRLVERHPDMLRHVDGRVQAMRTLAALLIDLPAAQVPPLARYLASRTHVGVDTVAQVVVDALEQSRGQAVNDANARASPATSADDAGPSQRTSTTWRGQPPPLRATGADTESRPSLDTTTRRRRSR